MTKHALQRKLHDLYTAIYIRYIFISDVDVSEWKAEGLPHVTIQHFIIFVLLKFVPTIITFVSMKMLYKLFVILL